MSQTVYFTSDSTAQLKKSVALPYSQRLSHVLQPTSSSVYELAFPAAAIPMAFHVCSRTGGTRLSPLAAAVSAQEGQLLRLCRVRHLVYIRNWGARKISFSDAARRYSFLSSQWSEVSC